MDTLGVTYISLIPNSPTNPDGVLDMTITIKGDTSGTCYYESGTFYDDDGENSNGCTVSCCDLHFYGPILIAPLGRSQWYCLLRALVEQSLMRFFLCSRRLCASINVSLLENATYDSRSGFSFILLRFAVMWTFGLYFVNPISLKSVTGLCFPPMSHTTPVILLWSASSACTPLRCTI